ncbi:hypothetical protein DIPPA_30254 [Diplonema papillatum]|nr:hypothetical protein DIPPA_30254 [Diplonema papillatum]
MEPFECIKHKTPLPEFAPKSSQYRPQSKATGGKKPVAPPAVGAAGRAVQVKKVLAGKGLDTAAAAKACLALTDAPSPAAQPHKNWKTPSRSYRITQGPDNVSPRTEPASPSNQHPGDSPTVLCAYKRQRPTSPLALATSPVAYHPSEVPNSTLQTTLTNTIPPSPCLASCIERPEGCTVEELAPDSQQVVSLKKLALDESVPESTHHRALRCPRFTMPTVVDVKQGAGPQCISRFAISADEDAGCDQALCYNVWAHSIEVFAEAGHPTIDCTGTLFFTPSSYVGGSSIVTVVLSDNAAVDVASGVILTSPPVTMRINVSKASSVQRKMRDWRSQNAKANMPVAVLDQGVVLADVPALTVAPSAGKGSPPCRPAAAPAADEPPQAARVFPKDNIHKLRPRTRVRGYQDRSLRKIFGACALTTIYLARRRRRFDELFTPGFISGAAPDAPLPPEAPSKAAFLDAYARAATVSEKAAAVEAFVRGAGPPASGGSGELARMDIAEALRLLVDAWAGEAGVVLVDDDGGGGEPADPTAQRYHCFSGGARAGNVRRSLSMQGEPPDDRTKAADQCSRSLWLFAAFLAGLSLHALAGPMLELRVAVLEAAHGADHQATASARYHLAENKCYAHEYAAAHAACAQALSAARLVFCSSDAEVSEISLLAAFCAARKPGGAGPPPRPAADAGLALTLDTHRLLSAALRDRPRRDAQAAVLLTESFLFLSEAHRRLGSLTEAAECAAQALATARDLHEELRPGHPEASETEQQEPELGENPGQTAADSVLGPPWGSGKLLSCLVSGCWLVSGLVNLQRSRYKGDGGALHDFARAHEAVLESFDAGSPEATMTASVLSAANAMHTQGQDGLAALQSIAAAKPDSAAVHLAIANHLVSSCRSLHWKDKRQRARLFAEAADHVQRALRLETASPDKPTLDPSHALTLELAAVVQEEHKDYQAALVSIEAALGHLRRTSDPAERIGVPGHSGCWQRLFELRLEIMLKLPTAAASFQPLIDEYHDAMVETQRAYGEWDPHAVFPMLNLAEVCYSAGECELAHRYFAKALAVVDAANMHFLLGNLFKPSAQLRPSEVQERDRLATERMSPHQCTHLGNILGQIASVYEKQGLFAESESSCMQALAAFEIAGQPQHLGVCYTLDTLARILYYQGFHGDALAYFDKADHIRSTYHAQLKEEVQLSKENIHVVSAKIRRLGYHLVRHESTGKFPIYI